jgi:uncharacterized membrane protein
MYPDSGRNFETNKILGGVGALLTAIGALVLFRGIVGIVGLVGIVLLVIALRGLSDDFKDCGVFRRAVGGFIFGLIGTFIAIAVLSAFSILTGFFFTHIVLGSLVLVGAIIGWVVMFIFFVLSGIFYRLTFYSLAEKSRVPMLRTGALILLIGSVLTIVLVGFVLMFVAWILIAVGLFSLRSPTEQAPSAEGVRNVTPPPSTGAPSDQVKFCPNCGAENNLNGTFCIRCGKRLNP